MTLAINAGCCTKELVAQDENLMTGSSLEPNYHLFLKGWALALSLHQANQNQHIGQLWVSFIENWVNIMVTNNCIPNLFHQILQARSGSSLSQTPHGSEGCDELVKSINKSPDYTLRNSLFILQNSYDARKSSNADEPLQIIIIIQLLLLVLYFTMFPVMEEMEQHHNTNDVSRSQEVAF